MPANYLKTLGDAMNFPEGVPAGEAEKLFAGKMEKRLKAHEFLLQAGEVPRYIGYVVSGLLRLYYIDAEGKDSTKHFAPEGTLAISYSAFLQRTESRFFIQALEDTHLYLIDYRTYQNLLHGHPCWQTVARKLANLLFILKEKREAELLLQSAQERYQQFRNDFPDIEQRVHQYHIASYLGITPESLSRIRADLK